LKDEEKERKEGKSILEGPHSCFSLGNARQKDGEDELERGRARIDKVGHKAQGG
jgi:hypothetical protein